MGESCTKELQIDTEGSKIKEISPDLNIQPTIPLGIHNSIEPFSSLPLSTTNGELWIEGQTSFKTSAMHRQRRANDSVHWFMSGLTSRVVAESGIPSDRFHLGKLVLQSFKDAPDFVMQIDGATDESESNFSALERTVRCAISLKNLGLQYGDVMVLMAPNHIDLAVPFYAALYLGITIAVVDRTLTVYELEANFSVSRPKIVFCQSEKASDIQVTLNKLELEAEIITFDKGDYLCSFSEFLDKYGDDTAIEDFKPTDFDPEDTIALLIATSGTTGIPKAVAATHKNFAITGPYWCSRFTSFPSPTRMVMIGAPLQWLTALVHFLFSVILRYTRLQTSSPMNQEHAYHLLNTYKPTTTILSPTLLTSLIKPGESDNCDFSSLELIMIGGSAVPHELIEEIKKIAPEADVIDTYGMSELTGIGFHGDFPPPGSCGKPLGCLQYRLVDIVTQEDIIEPNIQGELWLKGPGIFKGYYNNIEATEDAFAEDSWFKTGDIFYRDENWNFFFVERFKLLLKYMSYHVSPVEVENVIRTHPGVFDVAVTGIPDPGCGDLVVACVVAHPGHEVTAQEIKDLVKDTLTDSKQLRGGVIFVSEIPMTTSTKVHRRKLKEMVLRMERE